jgi:hypothetical protein
MKLLLKNLILFCVISCATNDTQKNHMYCKLKNWEIESKDKTKLSGLLINVITSEELGKTKVSHFVRADGFDIYLSWGEIYICIELKPNSMIPSSPLDVVASLPEALHDASVNQDVVNSWQIQSLRVVNSKTRNY